MIIDFHTHIYPPQIKQNREKYASRDPNFAALYSSPKAKLATAEELIACMDRDGVEVSVVANFSWSTHELCVQINDYILESVSRYPGRLIGFGTVQLYSPGAMAEIGRCIQGGMKGIGEMRPEMTWLDSPKEAIAPLINTLIKHKLILLIHASEPVGHTYPGKGQITPDRLYPLITSFPELTLVCAHWGGGLPFYALMPEVKKAMSHVYFDTAASPYLYSPEIYKQAIPLVGADKILFGSDYPLLAPGRLLKDIKAQHLSEDEERLILSGNARKLLGIQRDE